MNSSHERKLIEDFKNYSNCSTPIPEHLQTIVINQIKSKLWPKPALVFLKVLTLHFIAGVFSLIICDQFGIRPFDVGFSLAEYFMSFGHSLCMFFCGLIFLMASMIVALVILSREELLVLKSQSLIFIGSLILFSLGFFFILGADFIFNFTLLWILGAFLGGIFPLLFVRNTTI